MRNTSKKPKLKDYSTILVKGVILTCLQHHVLNQPVQNRLTMW